MGMFECTSCVLKDIAGGDYFRYDLHAIMVSRILYKGFVVKGHRQIQPRWHYDLAFVHVVGEYGDRTLRPRQ